MSTRSELRLSLACGDYDIKRGLDRIQGVDAVTQTMSSTERHWRLPRHHEFDICELSMASYLVMRDRHHHVDGMLVEGTLQGLIARELQPVHPYA